MAHANHNVTYCTKIVNMFVHENKMTAAARLLSSVFSVNWSMLLLLHVSCFPLFGTNNLALNHIMCIFCKS